VGLSKQERQQAALDLGALGYFQGLSLTETVDEAAKASLRNLQQEDRIALGWREAKRSGIQSGLAGLEAVTFCRDSVRGFLALFSAKKAGLNPDAGRWVLMHLPSGILVNFSNKREALAWMRDAAQDPRTAFGSDFHDNHARLMQIPVDSLA